MAARGCTPFQTARLALLTALVCIALSLSCAFAHAENVIRAGVLKFGTVNWLLNTVQHHELDRKHGYRLEQLELASSNATAVALLSREVDTIVTDWFWAMRQRAAGEELRFFPYSRTLGALIVQPGGTVKSLADLKGRNIGVAGGPLDKSWLLMRAWAKQQGVGDLADVANPVFAAPPLLAGKMRAGEFDAALIYWHFAARLEAAGLVQLHDVEDAMLGLGISPPPPLIGFVYRDPADDAARKAFDGFRSSIHDAARLLVDSDEEWQRLRPLLKADTDEEFIKLRDRFRDGQLKAWTQAEVQGARKLFEMLADAGGNEIVGAGVTFDDALFDGVERP